MLRDDIEFSELNRRTEVCPAIVKWRSLAESGCRDEEESKAANSITRMLEDCSVLTTMLAPATLLASSHACTKSLCNSGIIALLTAANSVSDNTLYLGYWIASPGLFQS